MAALIQYKPGCFAVQFVEGKKRPVIYLGPTDRRSAEVVRGQIEGLLRARNNGQALSASTIAWLGEIDREIHAKLAKAGLVAPRHAAAALSLAGFLDGYIKGRTDLKVRTRANLNQVRNGLVAHFGAGREISAITRGEIGDWHRKLKACGLARATIAMHVKKARQFFADAMDRKYLTDNPVRGLKAGGMANPDRFFYVPLLEIARVIEVCPNIEWKLIFGLARYAALRTPSETHALCWADVDWNKCRLTVRATKTEHHHGGGVRQVPIGPLLLPLLREAFEKAQVGAKYVIASHRTINPSTGGARILERAGIERWPKLFQNLRSSCETDWTASFPLHVACGWAGNSELVAKKHYLQTTEKHFDAAVKGAAYSAAPALRSDEKTLATIENQVASVYVLPPRGVKQGALLEQYRGIPRHVLRKALRRLRAASPYLYQSTMTHLRSGGR